MAIEHVNTSPLSTFRSRTEELTDKGESGFSIAFINSWANWMRVQSALVIPLLKS